MREKIVILLIENVIQTERILDSGEGTVALPNSALSPSAFSSPRQKSFDRARVFQVLFACATSSIEENTTDAEWSVSLLR